MVFLMIDIQIYHRLHHTRTGANRSKKTRLDTTRHVPSTTTAFDVCNGKVQGTTMCPGYRTPYPVSVDGSIVDILTNVAV